jgi:hypothetical protein
VYLYSSRNQLSQPQSRSPKLQTFSGAPCSARSLAASDT